MFQRGIYGLQLPHALGFAVSLPWGLVTGVSSVRARKLSWSVVWAAEVRGGWATSQRLILHLLQLLQMQQLHHWLFLCLKVITMCFPFQSSKVLQSLVTSLHVTARNRQWRLNLPLMICSSLPHRSWPDPIPVAGSASGADGTGSDLRQGETCPQACHEETALTVLQASSWRERACGAGGNA